MPENVIRVVGAKEHNLKNVTVEIPRDKFVVITGLSGSGKSSLAFDTIFAEGQRRYVESLSAYARQFLGQMDKPDVEYIEGLSPAVSIDQKGSSHNPRSTVGTVTEIYDYLRLLYARIGIPHCPICGREVVRQSAQEIVEAIEKLPESSRLLMLAPVIRGRKGTHESVLEEIAKAGFVRARINGEVYQLDTDKVKLDRYKMHNIEAVVDRLVIRKEEDAEAAKAARTRMTDSVETALRFGQGTIIVQNLAEDAGEDLMFSESLSCPEHGSVLPEIEPRTFSFNTPHGACPECQGLGTKLEIDPALLIPDKKVSFNDGAITALEWGGPRDEGGYYWSTLEGAARAFKINLNAPVEKLSQKDIDLILYGSKGREVKVKYKQRGSGRDYNFSTKFEGVIPNLERRFRETNSEYSRARIMEFMSDRPCPACNGARLRPEALGVTVLGDNILQVTQRPVLETLQWAQTLTNAIKLNQRQTMIAKPIIKEINERLGFMVDVGLDYLTLDRSAGTLSGGEAQRIRLATQIGSRLMGVLYVLDEPSIGLHARDNERLLHTLTNMRDIGNTVLVVEHDEETIRRADWVIDMGPGAGENGGQVVADGSVADILASKKSLTGAYLSGRKAIEVPKQRRAGNGKSLIVRGASENNLKDLDIEFPLGKLICITGVSGSGKSSLMNEIVYKALARELNGAHLIPGAHKTIEGMEHLDKIINIDQSPIGRTPRSNPGTYTGLFNLIRDLFAELPESKARGYKPGRFSFNVRGGRCEACEGQGEVRIEMQFLPDIYVPCEICHGARFNSETLQVKFKDMSIADVLALSIDRALEQFSAFPAMASKLETLRDVGLGYIRVGQSAPTLSGGEAQRVKLAKELSKRSTGQTIYVLDEPSVGLHTADVHKLIEVLQRLVDSGNTVLIIEHNMDIIKVADHIIDLGPEGGLRGGELLAEGTPEQVVKVKASYTGKFLKPYLKVK